MIRGSDGLDYENLTEKLLGNPAKTYRNRCVLTQRANGFPKDEQEVWSDAYDAEFALQIASPFNAGTTFTLADHRACTEADRVVLAYSRNRHATRRVAKPLFAD